MSPPNLEIKRCSPKGRLETLHTAMRTRKLVLPYNSPTAGTTDCAVSVLPDVQPCWSFWEILVKRFFSVHLKEMRKKPHQTKKLVAKSGDMELLVGTHTTQKPEYHLFLNDFNFVSKLFCCVKKKSVLQKEYRV